MKNPLGSRFFFCSFKYLADMEQQSGDVFRAETSKTPSDFCPRETDAEQGTSVILRGYICVSITSASFQSLQDDLYLPRLRFKYLGAQVSCGELVLLVTYPQCPALTLDNFYFRIFRFQVRLRSDDDPKQSSF